MNLVVKGATDVTRYVVLISSVTGAPSTGYTITDLDLQYTRNRTAPATKVDATALAATNTAHTDNRGIEVNATSSPGLYRIDWPDAAFATGVDKVLLVVSGSNLFPAYEEIQLTDEEAFGVAASVPIVAISDPAGSLAGISDGLTVRDQFALQALLGLLAADEQQSKSPARIVEEAWAIADELWSQR